MKLAAMPAMPAASRSGRDALQLLVGGEHRAAHQPLQIGILGDQAVEDRQRLRHRIGFTLLVGEGEQSGGVASRHAGNDGVVLRQGFDLSKKDFCERDPPRSAWPNLTGIKLENRSAKALREAPTPKGACCLT